MYADRILILIPHPDDEVVGCCAAIGRAVAQGCAVAGLYLTTGIPAPELLWPWQRRGHAELVRRRRREAMAAAALLDLRPAGFLDIPGRRLKDRLPQAEAAARRVLAETAAEVLWVPAYEGGHQDHDAANALAATLADAAPSWEFAEYNFKGGQVRSQEFPFVCRGEATLDLSAAEMARKRAALAVYASERGNLTHVRAGRECFRRLAAYDYAGPPHPGRLFYERFHWVPFRHPRIDFTTSREVCRRLAAYRGTKL